MTTQPSGLILPEKQKPWVIVAGFGRCGMSVTMQILYAGGIGCTGTWPDFESEAVDHGPIQMSFLQRFPGRAVKVINPHLATLPPGFSPYVLIWCDRDPKEQAKSWAKFSRHMMGIEVPRAKRDDLQAALERDRKLCMLDVKIFGLVQPQNKLILKFEETIRRPERAAERIADFLKPWFPRMNRPAMAKTVVERDPRCAAHLEVELRLTALAECLRESRAIIEPAMRDHAKRMAELAAAHRGAG